MILNLYLVDYYNESIKHANLKIDEDIIINEYDYVLFEIEAEQELKTSNCRFILGNTIVNIDDYFYTDKGKYFYYLDNEDLESLLPSKQYFSKSQYKVKGSNQKFSRIFINELGNCKPEIKVGNEIFSFQTIRIKSPKINDENFIIIIKYLMFNNYFDDSILYKNTLNSDKEDLKNSFLEGLKKLYSYILEFENNLYKFKIYPLDYYKTEYNIQDYNYNSIVDNKAAEWIVSNISELRQVSVQNNIIGFKNGSKIFQTEKILQPTYNRNFDNYENRIIVGFLGYLTTILRDKKSEFKKLELRSRNFSDFNDYLLANLNDLIAFYLEELVSKLYKIRNFFENHLLVKSKLYEFPSKLHNFRRKPHYNQVLDLIIYSRTLFALKTQNNAKFNLEIESFDKLYEVFCLYLIKDAITSLTNVVPDFFRLENTNNKLSGKYCFLNEKICINLYYENFPKGINQLTKTTEKYHENPDFIIEISVNDKDYYLIMDAKYKIYNQQKFHSEISRLSFKYLHKIGTIGREINVIGLYTISLNKTNSYSSIFKREHDISSPSRALPQLGKIEINPEQITVKNNPILSLLKQWIIIIKEEFNSPISR